MRDGADPVCQLCRQKRARGPINEHAKRHDRTDRKHRAEAQGFVWRNAATRQRTRSGASHTRIDVSVVPHVQSARGSGPDSDRDHGDGADDGIERPWRRQQCRSCGQNDERHDARFHQLDEIADTWLDGQIDLTNIALNAHFRPIVRIRYSVLLSRERRANSMPPAAPKSQMPRSVMIGRRNSRQRFIGVERWR